MMLSVLEPSLGTADEATVSVDVDVAIDGEVSGANDVIPAPDDAISAVVPTTCDVVSATDRVVVGTSIHLRTPEVFVIPDSSICSTHLSPTKLRSVNSKHVNVRNE